MHIFALAFAGFIIFLFLSETVGFEMAVVYMIAVSCVIVALFIAYTLYKGRSTGFGMYFRGGLTSSMVKYIAAKHMQLHHHVDVFMRDGGSADPTVTSYSVPFNATRCYPSSGEEAWYVRMRIHDDRYFAGLPTQVIIYVDGAGNVMNDLVMNSSMFYDEGLWREPELWFRKFTSKTPRPRSLKEVIARKVEDTGEIPADIGAEIIRTEMEGAKKKVE